MADDADEDDDAPVEGHEALARAHGAKPGDLAAMRGELEWATTQKADPALWLALGVVYLRLGDRASAETTLRHAEARVGDVGVSNIATAVEIQAALDATRGAPLDYQGPGVLRTGPKRRIYVELPDAKWRWAALRVGELLRAGVTPKAGETVTCRAKLGRRGWDVIALKPTGQSPKGTLGKDGTYVRCGELRFLPLVEPCPQESLRWDNEAWRTQAGAMPIKLGNDRKTRINWNELGVSNWAELAAKFDAAASALAPAANGATAPTGAAPPAFVDDGTGKLSAKGKHLVIGAHARPLIEADICEPNARRGRYASWRAIVDSIPYLAAPAGEAASVATVRDAPSTDAASAPIDAASAGARTDAASAPTDAASPRTDAASAAIDAASPRTDAASAGAPTDAASDAPSDGVPAADTASATTRPVRGPKPPSARGGATVAVDWAALSVKHAILPAVSSWAALAAVLDARPPPPKAARDEERLSTSTSTTSDAPAEPPPSEPSDATGSSTDATGSATDATGSSTDAT